MKNFKVVLTELIDNEPVKETLTMQFLPRRGDILLIGDKYKEVVFVVFDAEDLSNAVTLLVNCMGDKEETDHQLLKELTNTNTRGLDWV
jgi:hypothetical protein